MSAAAIDETITLAPYRFSGSWLVGATTYAMDRAVPQVELIYQPGGEYDGCEMTFSLAGERETAPAIRPSSRFRKLRARLFPRPSVDLGDAVFYDARSDAYFNWSHQVNFFLTVALAMRERGGCAITVVLPERMPAAASALYRRFGFDVVATDGPVVGRPFRVLLSHNEIIAARRHELIAPFMGRHDADEAVFPTAPELPLKVFLPRRDNRVISNEPEIEALLARHGYVKVYAEDLSVEQQFALLRQATHLVAVHGAALAPLQFRSATAPAFQFVEICPVGHMTRMFRVMCEQVGGRYCAVRGRLKASYVEGLYAAAPFLRFSGDSFEVDPQSLRVALRIAETGTIIEDYPDRWPLDA
jgi:hypothetical protein